MPFGLALTESGRTYMKEVHKKLTMLLAIWPLAVLADLPSPTYINRLTRIGYEIFPMTNSPVMTQTGRGTHDTWALVSAFVLLGMGVFLLRALVKLRIKKGFAVSSWVSLLITAVVCIFLWRSADESSGVLHDSRLRPANELFPEEMGLNPMDARSIIHSDQSDFGSFEEGRGWIFPEQVTVDEKREIERKMATVKDELQRQMDADRVWVCHDYYYMGRRSMKDGQLRQMYLLLERHPGLARKCAGIPIEWLINNVRWDVYSVRGYESNGWGDRRPHDDFPVVRPKAVKDESPRAIKIIGLEDDRRE